MCAHSNSRFFFILSRHPLIEPGTQLTHINGMKITNIDTVTKLLTERVKSGRFKDSMVYTFSNEKLCMERFEQSRHGIGVENLKLLKFNLKQMKLPCWKYVFRKRVMAGDGGLVELDGIEGMGSA